MEVIFGVIDLSDKHTPATFLVLISSLQWTIVSGDILLLFCCFLVVWLSHSCGDLCVLFLVIIALLFCFDCFDNIALSLVSIILLLV